MADIKNWVIEFEDSTAYNCETREEAIKQFRQEYGDDVEILNVFS